VVDPVPQRRPDARTGIAAGSAGSGKSLCPARPTPPFVSRLCPFPVESARFLAQPSAPYRPGLLRRYAPRKDERRLRSVLDRPLTSSLRAAEGGAAIQGCKQSFGTGAAHVAPCRSNST